MVLEIILFLILCGFLFYWEHRLSYDQDRYGLVIDQLVDSWNQEYITNLEVVGED